MSQQTMLPSTVKGAGSCPPTGALKQEKAIWKMKAVKKACFGDLPLVIWLDPGGSSTITIPIPK